MKQIRAATFKARCFQVIEAVQATGEPVLITKRGAPLVKIIPVETAKDEIFGFMAGEFKVTGDIVKARTWPLTTRSTRQKPQPHRI